MHIIVSRFSFSFVMCKVYYALTNVKTKREWKRGQRIKERERERERRERKRMGEYSDGIGKNEKFSTSDYEDSPDWQVHVCIVESSTY